jgi:SAM-dependent methyltransferase
MDFSETFHGQRFSLHTCGSCSLTYTHPTPPDKLLGNIYSGEYWAREKAVRKRGCIAGLAHKFNKLRLAATIRPLLRRLPRSASILEVGCGSGQLAEYMKRKGYDVEVTDIDRELIEEVSGLYGIPGYCGDIKDIDLPHAYDAVVFNNVLEHLPKPVSALKRASEVLVPGGYVFIEVPNAAGLQSKLFKATWYHLDIPKHLFHFSPQSLQKIASGAALEKVWLSTFSPRISAAGYAASLFPVLRPERIRKSWSKWKLFAYLGLQMLFLPVAAAEALLGRGSAIRAVYQKK